MEKRTKLIWCLFFFFSFGSRVYSQDIYYVTLVKGEVKKSDGTKIKTGDKLEFPDKVVFSKKDCRLILLHPQKGRFVLEPGNTKQESSGEFLVSLMNNLLDINTQKLKLSSRGAADLDDFFTVDTTINDHLLFIGETKIDLAISKHMIKDSINDYFFLQYISASGKIFNRKLNIVNNNLVINRTDFLFDGKEPSEQRKVKIGFIQNDGSEKKVIDIASFKPVFMTLDDCKIFIKTIKELLGNRKDKVMRESILQLYSNYGKPDENMISEMYDQL